MLRIGYADGRLVWKFLSNVRAQESFANIVETYWVIDKKVARSIIADLSADIDLPVRGQWLDRRLDEVTERLWTCAKRRGIKLLTGQELQEKRRKAVDMELDAAEKRLTRLT